MRDEIEEKKQHSKERESNWIQKINDRTPLYFGKKMREKREKKKKFHRNPTIVPPHTRIVPLGRGPRRAFNVAVEGDV